MRKDSDGRGIAGDTDELLDRLHRKGVRLWMERDGLRYRAPRGALTAHERLALTRSNGEIARVLQRRSLPSERGPSPNRNAGLNRAPLSFTQLEYWYDRLQYGGRPIRNIASAFRLRGPLRIDLLRASVQAVVRRHEALRTRIALCEDMSPVQEICDQYGSALEEIQIGPLPETRRDAEIERQIQCAILNADDYHTSQLFKAVLLTVDESQHVLIFALDHIISDRASLHLLSGEAFTGYVQLLKGSAIELPPVPVQFPEYAARLRAQRPEILARVCERFNCTARTRFPEDRREGMRDGRTGFGLAQFAVGLDLASELRAWARRHGTTTVIAALTAYAAVVLRWCHVNETVIQFMTDGRTRTELERTVGYLAFSVYIRAALESRSTFIDLLRIVTEEYCRAQDEADFGYSIARTPRSEFTRNTIVNWLPAAAPANSLTESLDGEGLSWSPMEFSNPVFQLLTKCDQEPSVIFTERNGDVIGQMSYPRDRFSDESMPRLTSNITQFLAEMVKCPSRRVMDMELK